MPAEEILQLKKTKQKLAASDADLSGSTFNNVSLGDATFSDINMAGISITNADASRLSIHNANLSGAMLVDCNIDGMTIDGVLVADLQAAYRELKRR